jgi:hypothetical protein
MVDMTAIGVISTSLNTIVNITKAMKDVHDATLIDGKVFELNRAILETQQSVFAANQERTALIERVRELEKEISDARNWETEKQKYELVRLTEHGPFAYASKGEMSGGEPPYHICATCYDQGKKSILHPETRSPRMAHVLICNMCDSVIYKSGIRQPEHSSRGPTRGRR